MSQDDPLTLAPVSRTGPRPSAPPGPLASRAEVAAQGDGASSWRVLASPFIAAMIAEGGLSPLWIRTLRSYIERTPELLARAGLPADLTPERLSPPHLKTLRAGLPWAQASVRLYFTALRRFLRWRGLPLADHPTAWRLPGGEEVRRRWLDREGLLRLFDGSEGATRVVVALEGFNGLRRVEVLRLRAEDIDWEDHRLRVRGKGRYGGKWRTIPMASRVEEVLRAWVASQGIGRGRLLVYSGFGVNAMLARAARQVGLPRRVANHDLRRTFGRLAYQSGMTLVDVRNILGHDSVDQTVVYIGMDEDKMREGLQRFERILDGAPP